MTARAKLARPWSGSDGSDRVFRQEGEIWTIVYEGRTVRLKDAKGLHHLSLLLHHPAQAIAATTLVKFERNASGASAEAARSAVTKRIKDAIRKISVHHPSLGHHLSTCIRTGYQCRYIIDPERPVTWSC